MKKALKYILIAVSLYGSFFVIKNFRNIQAFPSIISSYYAKEFCSCYFVIGQTKEFCHDYTRQYVPISDFQLNEEKKQVTVSGLGVTSVAEFSKGTGCQVQ
jgi:hypothetical protein